MPELFQRADVDLTTTNETSLYQAPNTTEADRAITLSCLVSNSDATASVDVTVRITNAQDQVISRTAVAIPVPAKSALELLPNRVVLKRGEKVKATASMANRLRLALSVLEITPGVS